MGADDAVGVAAVFAVNETFVDSVGLVRSSVVVGHLLHGRSSSPNWNSYDNKQQSGGEVRGRTRRSRNKGKERDTAEVLQSQSTQLNSL